MVSTRLRVSLNYILMMWPIVAMAALCNFYPRQSAIAAMVGTIAWIGYVMSDPVQYGSGRRDKEYSQKNWLFVCMREHFKLALHRTKEVQAALLKHSESGQAIFAFFPHGVNSDFRALMDGMMDDAFPTTCGAGMGARTLAASVLFVIPGIREICLKTGCVDADRKTATRCLKKGHSLFLCPGGQDEQVETIYGRERVYLKRRSGFVKLALQHGVPLVPAFCFGSSDVYYTSRAMHGLRRWLVRNARIAIPLYSGDWGLFAYPTPRGFPMAVPQNVVFGDPIKVEKVEQPTSEQVAAAHAQFIAALTKLFDEHKAAYGCASRTLEVL